MFRGRDVDGLELHIAASKGLKHDIKFLLDVGYKVDTLDSKGRTPLLCACENGYTETTAELLKSGAHPKARTPEGNTALHLAARGGYVEIIKMLLERKVDINSRNHLGWTPLHEAADRGNLQAIQSLIRYGAVVSIVNVKTDYTPLHLAVSRGHLEAARILLDSGALVNDGLVSPLHLAAEQDKKLIELLVERGGDITIKNQNGDTPLHIALLKGNRQVAETLVQLGADIEAEGYMKSRPLHYAVLSQPKVVSWLLSKKVNPNPVDGDGATPMMWASAHKKVRTRYILKKKGGRECTIKSKSIGYPPLKKEVTLDEKVLSWMAVGDPQDKSEIY